MGLKTSKNWEGWKDDNPEVTKKLREKLEKEGRLKPRNTAPTKKNKISKNNESQENILKQRYRDLQHLKVAPHPKVSPILSTLGKMPTDEFLGRNKPESEKKAMMLRVKALKSAERAT